MTWQLGAFGLLGAALAGGFAWYERVRPDARIVALVATLAAFAALGRIAFAAIPNVKPTTDIVLISGYALGGGPGFAVGALAGLTSNFFFGQGPWTPWQMAAWGITGLIGAALAWATSPAIRSRLRSGTPGIQRSIARSGTPGTQPSIGRWPLAIICCLVGFGFTAFQDVGDWVTYSDHSGAQLAVYVGKGLGFDAIHAAGCLLFALAFGPALTRSIQRFARRLQVTWVPSGAAAPLAMVLLAGALTVGLRAPPSARAASRQGSPVSYLLQAQNTDGGFGAAPGQSSNPLYSGWAALGLATAGYDPTRVTRGSRSALDYIRTAPGSDIGSLERTILVLSAAGAPDRPLVARLERAVGRNGSVSDQVNLTSFGVLALRGARVVPSARTLSWLAKQQDSDGGFSFGVAGGQSDVDDTGAALEALAGDHGRAASTARARAIAYLRRQQDRDGGFPSQPGQGSNAQSTAWAVQGLIAAGVSPASLRRNPLQYLRSLITANGSVDYSQGNRQTPVWVTGEVLMALDRRPLPLVAPAVARPRRLGPVGRLASGFGYLTAVLLAPLGLG